MRYGDTDLADARCLTQTRNNLGHRWLDAMCLDSLSRRVPCGSLVSVSLRSFRFMTPGDVSETFWLVFPSRELLSSICVVVLTSSCSTSNDLSSSCPRELVTVVRIDFQVSNRTRGIPSITTARDLSHRCSSVLRNLPF